jgi:SHS2 domain-containing protein
VRPTGEIKLVLSAESREQLVVDFLQELLFIHDTENIVLCQFEVETDGKVLKAVVKGEEFDEDRHPKRSVVKAVTYHKLEFDDEKGTLTILFDV